MSGKIKMPLIIAGAVWLLASFLAACNFTLSEFPQVSDPTTLKGKDCEVNSDCELGNICENGHCISGCRKDGDCPPNEICNKNLCEKLGEDGGLPPIDGGDDDDLPPTDAGEKDGDTADDDDVDSDDDDLGDAGNASDISDVSDVEDIGGDDSGDVSDSGDDDDADTGDDDLGDAGDTGPMPCQKDADCRVGYFCDDGICSQECQTPYECPPDHYCNSSGRCVQQTADGGGSDAGGPNALDLKGYFGVKVEIRSDVKASWVTAKNVATYQYLLFNVLKQEGSFIETKSRYCKIELPPVDKTTTTIRQEAVDNIPVAHDSGDYLSDGDIGALYSPPIRVEVMGAELQDPFKDLLPRRAGGLFGNECPGGSKPKEVNFGGRTANICFADALRDSDNDGIPGITAYLKNVPFPISGDVDGYIVLRNILQLRGVVQDNSSIIGNVEPGFTQETLAINHWLKDVASVSPEITIRQGENKFKMFRIDGKHNSPDFDKNGDGVIDCAEFMEQKEIIGF